MEYVLFLYTHRQFDYLHHMKATSVTGNETTHRMTGEIHHFDLNVGGGFDKAPEDWTSVLNLVK